MQNLPLDPFNSLTGCSVDDLSLELQEVSLGGQTLNFSIIKFIDPVIEFIFQPTVYI